MEKRRVKELPGYGEKWEQTKSEALEIFTDLLDTPNAQMINFVFNASVTEVPTVEYSVERSVMGNDN